MPRSLGSLFVVLLAIGTAHADSWQITQLTDNDTDDTYPKTAGSQAAWLGRDDVADGNDTEVYRYDGITTTKLTDNTISESSVEVSDHRVAWSAYDGTDSDIYLYDNGAVQQLTNSDTNDSSPVVSDTFVAWRGDVGADPGVYCYDGVSTFQLTSDGYCPAVSGSNVVWNDFSYDSLGYYDGTTTSALPEQLGYMSISGARVVGERYGDGPEKVVVHDIATGVTTVLSENIAKGVTPRISDDFVVWPEFTSTGTRLMVYDGLTTIEVAAADTFNYLYHCAGGLGVSWSIDGEVCLYDGATTHHLGSGINASVGDTSVVWQRDDGGDYEIMMATYVPEPLTVSLMGVGATLLLRRRKG